MVALLRGSSVAEGKELIDDDPIITEIRDNEGFYREAYPKEARRFFAAVDKCNDSYFSETMKDRERIISYGIIFRDMMGTKLPRAKDIRQGTPVFDELMLEGITFMSMYVNPDEAIKRAIKQNPELSSLDPEEVKQNEKLYRQVLTKGREILLEELEWSKAYLVEQRRKAEEYEKELEERERELDKREKEIAQREKYSLMLHSSKETDNILFLPGRKYRYDNSMEVFYITSPGATMKWESGKPPTLAFPPKGGKALIWMLTELTANKSRKVKDGRAILLTIEEWGRKRNLPLDTVNQRTKVRQDLLEAIRHLTGKEVRFPYTGQTRPLAMGPDEVKKGRAIIGYEVVLTNSVYDALKAVSTCTLVSEKIYEVSETLPGAFSIGFAMCVHWFMDNNIAAGTNGVLTMGSLYDKTFLPRIEEVKEGEQSWKRLIQEPMNRALDHLLDIGLLQRLEYDREFPGSFQEWLTVRVEYTLKDAPDRKAVIEEKKKQEEEKPKRPRRVAKKKKAPEKAESQIT